MGGKRFTPEQVEYLYSICSLYDEEMAELFNKKFCANVTARSMKDWCYRNKVPKREARTKFKKGCKTWNHEISTWDKKPIGYERLTKDGYIKIKAHELEPMVLKHHHVWEQAHGKIPDGHLVLFKNMDKTDCRLENLILVSRSEQARLNQTYVKFANKDTNLSCILMAKIKTLVHNSRTQ